jgi:uncharacterized protein YggU (UPF0235/DUF167 family)
MEQSPVPPGSPAFYAVRERDIALRVRARAAGRFDRIAGVRGDSLLVEVRAAPERGRANDAIVRLLADALGIRASDIVLRLGAGSPRKLFILPREARSALDRLAGAGS